MLVASDDVLSLAFQGTGQLLVVTGIVSDTLNGDGAWRGNGRQPYPFEESLNLGFLPAVAFLQARVELGIRLGRVEKTILIKRPRAA